jgi:hypothetical protein
MTSPGVLTSRADLRNRLSNVMQASRTIRGEVALTICESSEMRLAARQRRLASQQTRVASEQMLLHHLRTSAASAPCREQPQVCETESIRGIADAIAQILSRRGYAAFVATQPLDTASIQ